jgi:uncharacterized RDD family membrane protein YckC
MDQENLTGETRQTKNYCRIIMRDLYVFGHCGMIWFLLYWLVLNDLYSHMFFTWAVILVCMTTVTICIIARDIHFNN